MLKCPNCEKELTKNKQAFVCSNHHLFDVSRSGYVNLLLANETKRQTGDNQEMITARVKFMQAGYYHKLEKLLTGVLASLINQDNSKIVDCGCGPGFFTNSFKKLFPNVMCLVSISPKKPSKQLLRLTKTFSLLSATVCIYHLWKIVLMF